jgi:hypothetical protein
LGQASALSQFANSQTEAPKRRMLCWREARPHNGHSVNLARRNRR